MQFSQKLVYITITITRYFSFLKLEISKYKVLVTPYSLSGPEIDDITAPDPTSDLADSSDAKLMVIYGPELGYETKLVLIYYELKGT